MSADEAIQDILNFVYEDSEDEESDLDELYSEEEKSTDGDIEENSESDITSEEEINVEAPTERRKHRRKQLTYTRNVHSIESALDEDNYELLPIPRQENTIEGFFPDYDDNGKLKKQKKVKQFTNIPQNKLAVKVHVISLQINHALHQDFEKLRQKKMLLICYLRWTCLLILFPSQTSE